MNGVTSDRLVVLTRYPEPGQVKTRLISLLGADGAAELHRQMTCHTLSIAAELRRLMPELDVVVRVDGGTPSLMRRLYGTEWVFEEQGDGDLGTRIDRAVCDAFAHLTDVHVQPERGAAEGLAACLRHVQSQSDRPDVIFTGGDHIMDSTNQDRARTQLQWDLWRRVLKADCSLPVFSAIGNHDIWGWNKRRSGTTGDETLWGKKWGTDALGLDRSYHSFDRSGWHFVFLDSMLPELDEETKAAYTAGLDEAQFDWLQQDLAATAPATPVMIVSHIPIYSVAALNGNSKDDTGAIRFPRGGVHADYKRLKNLFRRHRNVKLAVSGHLHHNERIDYAGVTYLCNGAVCGGWWKGPHMDECDAGYAAINLYEDGSFDHEYVNYGWVYRPADTDAPTRAATQPATT